MWPHTAPKLIAAKGTALKELMRDPVDHSAPAFPVCVDTVASHSYKGIKILHHWALTGDVLGPPLTLEGLLTAKGKGSRKKWEGQMIVRPTLAYATPLSLTCC